MLDFATTAATPKGASRVSSAGVTAPPAPIDGHPKVYWLNDQTVAIDWFGKIDEHKCSYALARLQELIAERRPRYFFSDTSRATHYLPAVRLGAGDILTALRGAGVSEMAAVFNSPSIRVFTTAIAWVKGLELRTYLRREDAVRIMDARSYPSS